ncbi:hypothetical protein CCACVL1_08856 [Corchorus capsularis]|uniref:Protein kinase domain-containing protein n=1 Tax=Corchorus capsularis TaxID=210143 RepID=A0A1R3IYI4_COCAP|nr:hypothetical protein CCACVL1_08856 [Corchorus capsularis]
MINQILFCFLLLDAFILYTNAQQSYSGISALDCSNNDKSGPSSAFLYTCNGQNRYCKAFLIYKSQPPFDTIPAISTLTSSNQAELARINDVTEDAKFPTGKEVIIPVNCSCLGQYYQANATFTISSIHTTYYTVGTEAYQGLSTCSSLIRANPHSEFSLVPGTELNVPLRCACPTSNQTKVGTKYLLTYSVSFGDNITALSDRFNASIKNANGLQEKETLFPLTTILIPFPTEPSSSQTIIHKEQSPFSPPSENYPERRRRSKRKLYEGVGIGGACFLLVLSIILFTIFMFNKRKNIGVSQSGNERSKKNFVQPEDLRVEIASFEQGLRLFTFQEIQKATENFSSRNRINGSVYRGGFGRGKILAVKRMKLDVSKEVKLLKNINHFNLIKLQGICQNDATFFLLFEYMKKGSLRDWLNSQSPDEIGSWTRRIQIALDVANGLHYLHSFTKPAYVHGDIRSTNVLLNTSLRAKIANFSLARAVVNETSSVSLTNHVVGTRGYVAPEYIQTGQVTSKIDVYAFGVVLSELVTGKDAIIVQDGREVMLSAAVVSITKTEYAESELISFIDQRLICDDRTELALRMAQLSVACLTEEPTKRPSMEEVVSALLKIRADAFN